MKIFRLSDFPPGEQTVNTAWLREAVTELRGDVLGRTSAGHYSSFSPWRKQAGCVGSEMISRRCALLIVFLALYAKSGKAVCKLRANQLPQAGRLAPHCGQWLAAIVEMEHYEAIHKVLCMIAVVNATTEEFLERSDVKGKISLSTVKRYARAEGESLPLKKPIPPRVLKRALKRLQKNALY